MPNGGALFGVIIATVCALALMCLEALIPGLSLAGIAGVGVFALAVYLCYQSFGLMWTFILTAMFAAGSFVLMKLVLKSMKNGRISKSGMIMNEQVTPARQEAAMNSQIRPGQTGIAKTSLHPYGIGEFDGKRIHVTADKEYVEMDMRIRVERIEGMRIIVSPVGPEDE